MDPKHLVDRILASNGHVRFAAICSMDGNIVHSANKKGITNILTPEETEKTLQRAISSWKSRDELAHKTGQGQYVLAVYENLKRVTMPVDSKHLAYLTFDTEGSNYDVMESVRKLGPGASEGLSYEEKPS